MVHVVAWIGLVACLLLGNGIDDSAPTSQPATQPTGPVETYPPQRNLSATIRVEYLTEDWTFRCDDRGLFVEVRDAKGTRIERPEGFEKLTHVRRIVATSRELVYDKQFAGYAAIGIERLTEDSNHVEYLMIEFRGGISWAVIRRTGERRTLKTAADAMAIGLPGGDSMMLTLTDIDRGDGDRPERVITKVFVDHCPVLSGDMSKGMSREYECSPSEPAPQSKASNEPESDPIRRDRRESATHPEGGQWYSKIQPDTRTKEEDRIVTHDADSKLTCEAAFKFLLSTQTFADEAVGDGGDLSEQVASFRLLMKQPDALAVFKDLFKRGHSAGKLYALCAFRTLDRELFDREIKPFETDHSKLRTFSGCSIDDPEVHEIVRSENRCALRLSPGQSPAAWMKKTKCEGYVVDILGGGYTWSFLNP